MATFLALFALSASAAIVPVFPIDGEIVALVPDAQKKAMDPPTLQERIALFREDRERGGEVIRRDHLVPSADNPRKQALLEGLAR